MRFACALLGVALIAVPAAAQPFIVPLQQQRQPEQPPAPAPAPVAPPQSGVQTNEPSQAETRDNAQPDKAQPGDAANSTQAPGAQSNNASHATGQ